MIVLKFRGSNIGVYEFIGNSLVQVGNNIGGSQTTETAGFGLVSSRVLAYRNSLYAWLGNVIYKKVGSNWNTEHTISTGDLPTGENFKIIGFYPVLINRATVIYGIYYTTAGLGAFRFVKYDGTTWTEGDIPSENSVNSEPYYGGGRTIVSKNKLLYLDAYAGYGYGLRYFDPQSTVQGVIYLATANTAGVNGMTLFVHQNREFVFFHNNTPVGTTGVIYEKIGSTTVLRYTLTETFSGQGSAVGWSTGSFFYLLYYYDTGYVVRKFSISGNTVTDHGLVSILPSEMLTANVASRVAFIRGNSETLIAFLPTISDASIWNMYTFVNDATPLVVASTALEYIYSINDAASGTGEYYDKDDVPRIELDHFEPDALGYRLFYRAYSPSGTQQCDVRFYYNTNGLAPTDLCQLTSPTAGTVTGNGLLQDVPCDGTLKSVVWAFTAQGIVRRQDIRLEGRIQS